MVGRLIFMNGYLVVDIVLNVESKLVSQAISEKSDMTVLK